MKKLVFLLIGMVVLSACVKTPDSVSLEATVNAAVQTAIAPYESRYESFVTEEDLELSQQEQNKTIQQFISEQMDRNSIIREEPENPTTETSEVLPETVVINAGTKIPPTPTVVPYINSDTCVDRFEYISDITIPDGMVITPYTLFTKTWYIN